METRERKGLVLVELITLLGIGTMVTGLILPQIQFAREAARRAQCINNLKQMGLGLHNYLSANGTFPMSSTQGKGHATGHSGFTAILPYMEQAPLYNAYNFDLENWHEANATVVVVKVNTFLCPSNKYVEPLPAADIKNAHDKAYEGKSKFAQGHYGMNWGGVRPASGAEQEKSYGASWRGLLLTVVDPDSKVPTKNVAIADVTDGLSFTCLILEKRDSFGWAVGGWGGSEFDVNLLPNDPGKDPMARRIFTGSEHPGVVNLLMGDGSARFVKNTIKRPIWYAITTRASGEKVEAMDLE